MANEIDKAIDDAVEILKSIFGQMRLSDEEKRFVNKASKSIAEYSYNLLISLPPDEVSRLRPIVMAAAIAFIIGPSQTWNHKVGTLPPVQ